MVVDGVDKVYRPIVAATWFRMVGRSVGRRKICRSQQIHEADSISTVDHVYRGMMKDGCLVEMEQARGESYRT